MQLSNSVNLLTEGHFQVGKRFLSDTSTVFDVIFVDNDGQWVTTVAYPESELAAYDLCSYLNKGIGK